jgi:uncharacterized protein
LRKEWVFRWSLFVFGLMVIALGVALTIKGKVLGVGPWDVFHYGMFLQVGLSVGLWSIIIGFLLLSVATIITKKLPKLGAFLNMLLIGVFIDFFLWLLPTIDSLLGAIFSFIIGVVLVGYGIGLYVSADVGSGPRDSIMIIIVNKTGWSVQWVRNGMEVLVLILGWLLGGPVGIGTVIIAFTLGPIVGVALPQCQTLLSNMLEKKEQQRLAA